MTRDGELRVILEKYNISYEKSVNDNEKILARASLNDVENLLSFFKGTFLNTSDIKASIDIAGLIPFSYFFMVSTFTFKMEAYLNIYCFPYLEARYS